MPYWRLSTFYFFYFAVLGSLIPFWGVYLQSIGFNARQIGELMALLMFSRIVAPYIWGWLADHKGQGLVIVRVAALLAAISFGGVFLGTGFWWMAGVSLLFSFFWNATLPQLESATMSHIGGRAGEYGRVRLWGSVGFIVAVIGLGNMFDTVEIWWLLPVLAILMTGIWLSSLAIPDADIRSGAPHPEPLHKLLMRPKILAFLLICLLMQASHGPYYTFYTIYLGDFGYSKSVIGVLWAFGVLCEIGVFLVMHRLQARIGLRTILLLRWSDLDGTGPAVYVSFRRRVGGNRIYHLLVYHGVDHVEIEGGGMKLEGSCHCREVTFSLESNETYPYMRCYCSICRKTAGTGGYAINLGGDFRTLEIKGKENISVYQALITDPKTHECKQSPAQRTFCRQCGSALWVWDPRWPDQVHPHAGAIDTPLHVPPQHVHIMLDSRAPWVEPQIEEEDRQFDAYPDESLAAWHQRMREQGDI
jgi:PPP family 3-phenylpropionic acid transporter